MRGSRYAAALALALALTACGDDGRVEPRATGTAPPAPTTAASALTPSAPAATPSGPLSSPFSIYLKLSLAEAAVAEETYFADHGTYTKNVDDLYAAGLDRDPDVEITVVSASKAGYCLKGTSGSSTAYLSSATGAVSEKPCN